MVLYVDGRDVIRINTLTRQRTRIIDLPFDPRCTASACGWFCAGGDQKGYFAAFKIPEGADSSWPARPPLRIARLGREIVNSIAINRIYAPNSHTVEDVVAVLTNNDRSVRMYSLLNDRELPTQEFSFAMNHASVSPDSKTLIIVGDKETAYFYHRLDRLDSSCSQARFGDSSHSPSEWSNLCQVRLHKPQGKKDGSYFTTAWSQSGKLCAAGSEQGYITVFDVEALYRCEDAQEAIVAVVPSSRPETASGAVRTMCFSSDPWDLLIWAEDHGRVCVADIRTGLTTRQVIDLNPENDNVRVVKTEDISAALLDAQNVLVNDHDLFTFGADADERANQDRALNVLLRSASSQASFAAADYLTGYAARRAQQRAGMARLVGDDEANGLTLQERQILEGLRTSRRREDALLREQTRLLRLQEAGERGSQSYTPPHSISYLTDLQRTHSPNQDAASYAAAASGEVSSSRRREWTREHDSIRRGGSSTQGIHPRRRGSIIITSSTNALPISISSGSTHTAHGAPNTDAWRTIEDAIQREHSNTQSVAISLLNNHDASLSPSSHPTLAEQRNRDLGLPSLRALSAELDAERRHRPSQNTNDSTTFLRHREHAVDRRRNALLAGGGYESSLRRVNVAAEDDSLRIQRETMAFADPVSTEDSLSWGPGTSGVAMGHEGRTLYATLELRKLCPSQLTNNRASRYVGTEIGIFEMKMNYESRKYWPAYEPR